MGAKYLDRIEHIAPELLKSINSLKQNDDVGGASKEQYKEYNISPSTLRYISVAAEISKLFGNLNKKNIAEIGVGYGGQCRIINDIWNPASYTLIDIKPALDLTERYLSHFALDTEIKYKTMNELNGTTKYDFVISNYAFSEISRNFQSVYMNKVLQNSKAGYMIVNQITPVEYNSFSKDDLLDMLPNNPKIFEEIPNSHSLNFVIAWGI